MSAYGYCIDCEDWMELSLENRCSCGSGRVLSKTSRILSPGDPNPDRQGCTCQRCDREYRADLLVPDDVWEKISPRPVEGYKGGGLLCPSCIMERIVERGIWTAGKVYDSDIHIRHLEPGDLDRETLERAAEIAKLAALKIQRKRTKNLGLLREPLPHEYGNEVADAIRSLDNDIGIPISDFT